MKKRIFYLTSLLTLLFTGVSYASTPKIVSGTVDLIKTATGFLTIIIPLAAAAAIGLIQLQKMASHDNSVHSQKNDLMKKILIAAIIGASSTGIVTFVLSFYV